MKIEVISDLDGRKYHLRLDGTVHEECNTDQIVPKKIQSLYEFVMLVECEDTDLCERCFER